MQARHILHLLIAFCIIRVFQDFRDLGVLQDQQDLRAEKGRRWLPIESV